MPSFTEVVRGGLFPVGSVWRVSDRPGDAGAQAVLMKVSVAGTSAIVCLAPGLGGVPFRGTTYTSGTRNVEPVNVEVEHADHG